MPALTTIIAGIGLGISAIGAIGQMSAQSNAKDAAARQAAAQQEQARLEQQKADIANTRNLRTAVRQARIARGSVINQGANAGTSTSSGVVGGAGSVVSQNASNTSFFNTNSALNSQITETQITQGQAAAEAGSAQGEAATFGALGSLGGTVFHEAGGFKTIFSK